MWAEKTDFRHNQPSSKTQHQTFSFLSPNIDRGVVLRQDLTDLGQSGAQWSAITTINKGRKGPLPLFPKKDKRYQGNRDLVLNMPVTVIEESVWEWAAPICFFACDSAPDKWKCLKTICTPTCSIRLPSRLHFCSASLWQSEYHCSGSKIIMGFQLCFHSVSNDMNHRSFPAHLSCFCLPCASALNTVEVVVTFAKKLVCFARGCIEWSEWLNEINAVKLNPADSRLGYISTWHLKSNQ